MSGDKSATRRAQPSAMRILDLVHRWTGGLIGLLLALLGLTGAILLHRRAWIGVPHAGDAQIQDTTSLATVTRRLMANAATRPRTIAFADRDFGLDKLSFKGTSGAYVDQAGTLVTRWNSQWSRPELWLFDLHHHLLTGEVGETIVGLAGLAGVGFVVTGVILWWRTRKTFAFRLWPQRMTRPAIVRQHRDLGIVAAPLLLLSLVTGTLLVFRPLTAVVFGPGAPAAIRHSTAPPKMDKVKLGEQLDWGGMIVAARRRFPDAEIRSLSLPRGDGTVITIRMRRPGEWLAGGRTMAWFAPNDGRLLATRDARAMPRQARAYNLILPLHAADVGGLSYRLLMTLSGLTLGLLGTLTVWTFWFKKR